MYRVEKNSDKQNMDIKKHKRLITSTSKIIILNWQLKLMISIPILPNIYTLSI